MRILEYGTAGKPALLLIHGFESPYQVWQPCIQRYQADYHILVPVLPGHDVQQPSAFTSFAAVAAEIEAFCLARSIRRLYAVYGMSMGGVLAAQLWQNRRLTFDRVILESAPLLPFRAGVTRLLTWQYLSLTRKARARDPRVLRRAVRTMVREEGLADFLALLDQITDADIRRYLDEVGRWRLPADLDGRGVQLIYLYGGRSSELFFRLTAAQIKKRCPSAVTLCLRGRGHCEDALLHPADWLRRTDRLLAYKGVPAEKIS